MAWKKVLTAGVTTDIDDLISYSSSLPSTGVTYGITVDSAGTLDIGEIGGTLAILDNQVSTVGTCHTIDFGHDNDYFTVTDNAGVAEVELDLNVGKLDGQVLNVGSTSAGAITINNTDKIDDTFNSMNNLLGLLLPYQPPFLDQGFSWSMTLQGASAKDIVALDGTPITAFVSDDVANDSLVASLNGGTGNTGSGLQDGAFGIADTGKQFTVALGKNGSYTGNDIHVCAASTKSGTLVSKDATGSGDSTVDFHGEQNEYHNGTTGAEGIYDAISDVSLEFNDIDGGGVLDNGISDVWTIRIIDNEGTPNESVSTAFRIVEDEYPGTGATISPGGVDFADTDTTGLCEGFFDYFSGIARFKLGTNNFLQIQAGHIFNSTNKLARNGVAEHPSKFFGTNVKNGNDSRADWIPGDFPIVEGVNNTIGGDNTGHNLRLYLSTSLGEINDISDVGTGTIKLAQFTKSDSVNGDPSTSFADMKTELSTAVGGLKIATAASGSVNDLSKRHTAGLGTYPAANFGTNYARANSICAGDYANELEWNGKLFRYPPADVAVDWDDASARNLPKHYSDNGDATYNFSAHDYTSINSESASNYRWAFRYASVNTLATALWKFKLENISWSVDANGNNSNVVVQCILLDNSSNKISNWFDAELMTTQTPAITDPDGSRCYTNHANNDFVDNDYIIKVVHTGQVLDDGGSNVRIGVRVGLKKSSGYTFTSIIPSLL